MLMPSIFGENLFDDFFGDFGRPASRQVMTVSYTHLTLPTIGG